MSRIWPAKTAAILLAAANLLFALPVTAAPSYSGIYIFGDSLVDSGNARELAGFLDSLPPPFPPVDDPAPASLGYFNGRFTNGYNFADLLSLAVTGRTPVTTFPYGYPLPGGIPIPISRPEGNAINFAYGGAQIIGIGIGSVLPDASEQVGAYASLPGDADADALYILTFGGNDIRVLAPSTGPPPTGEVATATLTAAAEELAAQVALLYAIGAENILITGVPDIGLLPRYDEEAQRAVASAYSLQLDMLVRGALDGLTRDVEDELLYFSLFDFSRAVAADPGLFGLTNLTRPCLAVRTPGPEIDCTGFAFFDDLHPTAHVHGLVATALLDLLDPAAEVPEPAMPGVIGLGLLAVALGRRRRRPA